MEPEVTEDLKPTQDHQAVVFRLGEEHYGIDIFRVNEIIKLKEITPVPGTAVHILGLINLRGKTVPVVDLKTKLEMPVSEASDSTRIIVVETENDRIGVVVDAVTEVVTLTTEEIEDTPGLVSDERTDYAWSLAKRDDKIITLLDLDRALAA